MGTPARGRRSSPGHYRGYSEPEYDGAALSSVYVDAPDGTPLAVDVHLPARNGKAAGGRFPALFIFTPYRRAFRNESGDIVPGPGLLVQSAGRIGSVVELTTYGYAVVAADVRGKGASFGSRAAPNDLVEARDGAALVDWIERQSWSDGTVGIFGCSYYGATAWAVAAERPRALKAAMIGCTAFDKYEGFGGRGGIKISRLVDTTPDEDRASRPVGGDIAALEQAVGEHRANTDIGTVLPALDYRDGEARQPVGRFWEQTSIHTRLDAINRPGLAVYLQGGWDDLLRRETVLSFVNLTIPRKLLIGPWGHCGTEGFDYLAEMHRFFDHQLRDIDNGIMVEPAITYYERDGDSGGRWRTSEVWPPPAQRDSLYDLSGESSSALPNNGVLTDGRSRRGGRSGFEVVRDIVAYPAELDAPRPTVSAGYRDERGLTFTTEPVKDEVVLTGHPRVQLWICTPDDDADVFAYLSDIAPHGETVTITEGQLRASHRRLGEAPYSTLGLPFHPGRRRDIAPLVPGRPTLLEFEMLPLARRIQPGHRLRLTVTGDCATGGGMPPVTRPARRLTIVYGRQHPSRLYLPVLV